MVVYLATVGRDEIDTIVGGQPLVVLAVNTHVIDTEALAQDTLTLGGLSDEGAHGPGLLVEDHIGIKPEQAAGVANPHIAIIILLHVVDIRPFHLAVVLVDEADQVHQAIGIDGGVNFTIVPAEEFSFAIGRDITVTVNLHVILAGH